MTDSAQDYTYQVLSVDSSGTAMIQMTSYDSLQHYFWYELESGDSDGTIASLVKQEESIALFRWSEKRQGAPSITIGSPVTGRYRTNRDYSEKPEFNFLTKALETYDSVTTDEVITHYSIRSLSDSEKAEIYSNLRISREQFELNLFDAGHLDSAQQLFRGLDVEMAAAWDGSPGAAFDWNNDKISGHGIRYVERMDVGTYRAYFDVPVHGAKYSVTTGIGGEDYSGAGASPRQLAIREMDSAYVEVHCERTDDAVNEDNEYFSIHVHPGDTSLTYDERREAIEFETQEDFEFGDSVSVHLRTTLAINDSDFAALLVSR